MAAPAISVKYIEGMRLTERERAALIEIMKKSGAADRRKSPRIVVEGNFSVLLTMDAPGGSTSYFKIYPWDLSRGGVGFFHRAFVYPGTRCTFMGLTFEGKPFTITGEVARCSHVSGSVHAVGTKLDAEIDPEAMLGAHAIAQSTATGAQSAHVEDWWSRIGTEVGVISRLARDKASPEAIRKAAQILSKHLATEPTIPAAPTLSAPTKAVPAPTPVDTTKTAKAPESSQKAAA